MKTLLSFILGLVTFGAAAQNPVIRNQFSTNVVGQPVLGRVLLGSTGSLGADFQLRSTNTTTSVSFGDQTAENRFRMLVSGAETTLSANSPDNTAVLSATTPGGIMSLRAESTINYLVFGTNSLVVANSSFDEWMRFDRFGGVNHLRATGTITLRAPLVLATNNLVAQGAFLGNVGLATNSAGATVDSLSGSLANFQTNQFTTNVPGNPVLGKVLIGAAGTVTDQLQVRSPGTTMSVDFGDQVLEQRFRMFTLINAGNSTLSITSTNTAGLTINAGGAGGVMNSTANQFSNTFNFSINPFVIRGNGEFAKFNYDGGLEHLTSTNLITLNAPTVTVTNNLNVGGSLNVVGNITASSLTISNLLWATNTYGSAVIDYSLGNEATTNMAGNLTLTGITGFNATNYNWKILHCRPMGSDRTLTIPAEWFSDNGGTSYVVTNGTQMDLLVEAQIGAFTNAFVKRAW